MDTYSNTVDNRQANKHLFSVFEKGNETILQIDEISFAEYLRIPMQFRSIISVFVMVCLMVLTFWCNAIGMYSIFCNAMFYFDGDRLF